MAIGFLINPFQERACCLSLLSVVSGSDFEFNGASLIARPPALTPELSVQGFQHSHRSDCVVALDLKQTRLSTGFCWCTQYPFPLFNPKGSKFFLRIWDSGIQIPSETIQIGTTTTQRHGNATFRNWPRRQQGSRQRMGCSSSTETTEYTQRRPMGAATSAFRPIPDRYETIGGSLSLCLYANSKCNVAEISHTKQQTAEVQSDLRKAGLESSNLVVAVCVLPAAECAGSYESDA